MLVVMVAVGEGRKSFPRWRFGLVWDGFNLDREQHIISSWLGTMRAYRIDRRLFLR